MTVPLAIDWVEAVQVSAAGFVGVFVTLALLYLSTVLFGAAVRYMEARRRENKTS